MGKEIEHKYLVCDNSFETQASKIIEIKQGYICRSKKHTVRVRIQDNEAFINIKGETIGDTRAEFEYAIPVTDACILISTICDSPIIEKSRYIVEYHGNIWEIDVFKGHLEGLIVAEIEIPSSDYNYDVPSFIGKNVTGDCRYYNANLVSGSIPQEK